MTTTPRAGCAIDAEGRITFELPAADGHALLLRLRPKKGQPEDTLHVLDLESVGAGRARAVLDADPVLAEGRWDVYLLDGSERTRLRPGPRDLRVLVEGQLGERPGPLAVRVPYVTKDGYLALRTWVRPAHAEVGRVDVTGGTLGFAARLHGASLRDGAEVRLRLRRGEGAVRTLEPLVAEDGRSFSFTVDDETLDSGVWDLYVRPAPGAPMIRLARLLDDVADRKHVFVYPGATAGKAVVRPYYTVDNELSLEVTRTG
jgi:hypothetical protein|uniref:hypothetical protein n=1 Tax=unclassified Streptomyces TaxID=2593676 RepID=UPI0024761ADB|nr:MULTISPECIES: hypothetical protein [unclassified Streptomyces]MDH6520826.1 hypothetical protein [Streptomyces sp. SAI-090]MDH6553045.1 hypothetical protein [Streptomyces sp. SAI-041]MDH6582911.1 hypothetical protein [Streptomyces sp. SAI-133]MDH6615082.1 hypothetical protein [Streptomyces sp. SAI-135]